MGAFIASPLSPCPQGAVYHMQSGAPRGAGPPTYLRRAQELKILLGCFKLLWHEAPRQHLNQGSGCPDVALDPMLEGSGRTVYICYPRIFCPRFRLTPTPRLLEWRASLCNSSSYSAGHSSPMSMAARSASSFCSSFGSYVRDSTARISA